MSEAILRLYEQSDSIHNLYVSVSNKEIFNTQQKNVSKLINIRSMTKSIVSLLIGIAFKEKHIKSLETPINYYLSDAPGHIVIRDLLTMSSGFDIDDKNLYGLILSSRDWVTSILDLPLSGYGNFRYKGVDYHLLSAIISKSTGLKMSSYAQANLFSELGINDVEWESDPQGGNCWEYRLKDII
ncbi:serine hydrolase [Psychrobacillus sp. NEAU-3TGS]|uniref:serine hydrolase domain-containing protein n=1 Tax=Psychrobacillus sp. NEAU-3TGS TaxID=2995412 RepID=UPI0024995802|nr:serine hydrolase [Psychrobacillus sp. NEAU-3TGS]MDI2588512.1 serine hydrolase [Psychrobacillus sp. NEAU-3TGS]